MKFFLTCCLLVGSLLQASAQTATEPKIVNIINFIRQIEPRSETGLENELYQTVAEQIAVMNQYNLKGTFDREA